MSMGLGDWLKSINQNKNDIYDDETKQDYPAYVINHSLSNFVDTIFHADQINRMSHLDKELQYTYYLTAVRQAKRFSPWYKPKKDYSVSIISEYYGCSYDVAKMYSTTLNESEVDEMIKYLDKGGVK